MLTRRNFLKGLLGGVAAVGLSPYIPKEFSSIKSVELKPATVRPFTAGEDIHAGSFVYIGQDGRYYNVDAKKSGQFVGIALNSGRAYIDPIKVVSSGVIVFSGVMPNEPYYMKRGK